MDLTSFASISMSMFFVAYKVGWAHGDGSNQCRFRSNPISEHLKQGQEIIRPLNNYTVLYISQVDLEVKSSETLPDAPVSRESGWVM